MVHFEIRNLSFAYPETKKKILKDLQVTIRKGEFVTLCGRSGSGKTTLLRHLKSVLSPVGKREGQVLYKGRDLEKWDLSNQAGEIGFVLQNPDHQLVTDKVWHELAFGLESLGMEENAMRGRVAEMANYFGIHHWFHKKVTDLSGGEKQLLNLASIMAMQPEVLILDEPTSQLDPIAAADFIDTLRKINEDLGTTVILSEHRLEQLFALSDRILVMEEGALIADDNPKRVGKKIQKTHPEIFTSFPTPMQIFEDLEEEGDSPLTVKEGRQWLLKKADGIHEEKHLVAPSYEEAPEALRLKEVWFRYEKDSADVLKGLSLSVPERSLFAVMGGNGSGKTTMLKILSGVKRPYRGKVEIGGKRIEKYKGGALYEHTLAFLPQDPQTLFVRKTVEEDLLEILPKNMGEEEKRRRIEDLARKTEITDLLSAHPYDLSGGEQQRAALCKLLLTEPKLLLLDEPTKGIDTYFKKKLASILRRLMVEGMTVLLVSHDVEFCASYADHVAFFFDGQILTQNTPRNFFSAHAYYTTTAHRMSRGIFQQAITKEDVLDLLRSAPLEGGVKI
ncbi:ABC transporter ATP-binding protein [Proteiniclasticum ruminis]|uniref:Energy-coupling factor transport system ATP-binding protein n=1 Tax=Proteiniclasticum ruminis TaxID=398199 RepID=A0A1I5C096_9CLOT|nr:ATP-binding cassette domain-containing protein [Proteiniclasticum ruminis]SFN80408.1 energy-coupling factor transport system ATP-binding protein [Proteiniclasticum ruminis]